MKTGLLLVSAAIASVALVVPETFAAGGTCYGSLSHMAGGPGPPAVTCNATCTNPSEGPCVAIDILSGSLTLRHCVCLHQLDTGYTICTDVTPTMCSLEQVSWPIEGGGVWWVDYCVERGCPTTCELNDHYDEYGGYGAWCSCP